MLFKENITGQEADIKTEFSIKREGDILHCFYKAFDTSFYSASEVDNGNLFDGDVVEIFIYIGEKDSYLEIEVAPNGTTFVAKITNRKINYIDNSFVKTKVEKKEKSNADNILKKYKHIKKLNKTILDEFIEKVYIGEYDKETKTRDIEIEWNFEF